MQTIETKILAATSYKPRRIRATHNWDKESITISTSRFDDIEDAHKHAAALLMRKLGWENESMIGGTTKAGMVWVNEDTGPCASPRIGSWTLRKLELEHDLAACGDNPHGG